MSRLFENSAKRMLAALIDDDELSDEQIDELEKMIKDHRESNMTTQLFINVLELSVAIGVIVLVLMLLQMLFGTKIRARTLYIIWMVVQ